MSTILETIYYDLNIEPHRLTNNKLPFCEQAQLSSLEVVDIDWKGRPFILTKSTAIAWRQMLNSAINDGIVLHPISGFRSYLQQREIIANKLNKGKSLDVILTETAIPGFSEHHTGRAIDISTADQFELNESFANTAAFSWLCKNAPRFDFALSYPHDNRKGIVYEPWHWCFAERSITPE